MFLATWARLDFSSERNNKNRWGSSLQLLKTPDILIPWTHWQVSWIQMEHQIRRLAVPRATKKWGLILVPHFHLPGDHQASLAASQLQGKCLQGEGEEEALHAAYSGGGGSRRGSSLLLAGIVVAGTIGGAEIQLHRLLVLVTCWWCFWWCS